PDSSRFVPLIITSWFSLHRSFIACQFSCLDLECACAGSSACGFMTEVVVIGGGFAGVEAAWQAAQAGARVCLYEMRPVKQTPAHRTDKLAEIVCSNSLKSDEPGTAPYLLKEE